MSEDSHRTLDLIVGIPFIVVGICGILIDVVWLISWGGGWPTSAIIFPAGLIVGFACCWFGYRVVFNQQSPISRKLARAARTLLLVLVIIVIGLALKCRQLTSTELPCQSLGLAFQTETPPGGFRLETRAPKRRSSKFGAIADSGAF
jgi:hypothetical protein